MAPSSTTFTSLPFEVVENVLRFTAVKYRQVWRGGAGRRSSLFPVQHVLCHVGAKCSPACAPTPTTVRAG